jgi:hypothetical protein
MRQAKTLILRVSRVRAIDCYCGVTRMRYEAVATSAPAKLWLIGDRKDTSRIVWTSTSSGRDGPLLIARRRVLGLREFEIHGWTTAEKSSEMRAS